VLQFHLLVVEAEGAHELHAADLEPDEVVGVVDDAHLVGFRVADAEFGGGGHLPAHPEWAMAILEMSLKMM